jgi:hypothetical protein
VPQAIGDQPRFVLEATGGPHTKRNSKYAKELCLLVEATKQMVSGFRQQFSHKTSCNRILARFLFVKSLTKGLNVLCCPFRAVTPFSDDMRPLLLNLRAHFAKIPLPTLFRIQGSYAVRFYLFCKS